MRDGRPTTEIAARRIAEVLGEIAVTNWHYTRGRNNQNFLSWQKRMDSNEQLSFEIGLNAMGSAWFITPWLALHNKKAMAIYFCDWDRRFDPPISQAPLVGTLIDRMSGAKGGITYVVDTCTDVDELEQDMVAALNEAFQFFDRARVSCKTMLDVIVDDDHYWRVCRDHEQRIRAAVALSTLDGQSRDAVSAAYQRLSEVAKADRFPMYRLPEFFSCVLRRHFDE